MRVEQNTRDRLVIEDFAWRIGAIFLVGGVGFGVSLHRDGEPLWKALLAACLFAIPAWTMGYRARVVFDRGEGVVRIEERRVGWHPRRSLPLAEIVAVENVEWYTQWSSTWRVELKLRGALPNVPLLQMFTWREERHAAVAAAIGAFLDVPVAKRSGSAARSD